MPLAGRSLAYRALQLKYHEDIVWLCEMAAGRPRIGTSRQAPLLGSSERTWRSAKRSMR